MKIYSEVTKLFMQNLANMVNIHCDIFHLNIEVCFCPCRIYRSASLFKVSLLQF